MLVLDDHRQDLHDLYNRVLRCETTDRWVQKALNHLNVIVVDHAHCEKKAAAAAMGLIHRYPEHYNLVQKMSRIAREELRHMEQVLKVMHKHKIAYHRLSPSRYGKALNDACRKSGLGHLIDSLIIGAFIEARSCERFILLVPELGRFPDLQKLYSGLIKSECRHYRTYIELAQKFAKGKEDILPRVKGFSHLEASLIQDHDPDIRFHSGDPGW